MTEEVSSIYPVATLDYHFSQEEIFAILHLIEQTKPEEVVSLGQLVQIGRYSFAQVRAAIAQQALSCTVPTRPQVRKAQKALPGERTAHLTVFYPASGQEIPRTVKLEIGDARCFILEFEFPVLEPKDGHDAAWVRFSDFRQIPHRFTFLSKMQRDGAAISDIQHMWSGLRWLCRNLREWGRDGITWPEDV